MGIFFKKKKKIEYLDVEDKSVIFDKEEETKSDDTIDFLSLDKISQGEYIATIKEDVQKLKMASEQYQKEYAMISAYLSDIQIIESLPANERAKLTAMSKKILSLMVDRKIYQTTETKLPEHRYAKLEMYEDEIPDAVSEIQNAEQHLQMVSKDLKMIEAEKYGLRYDSKDYQRDKHSVGTMLILSFIILITVFLVYVICLAVNAKGLNDIVFLVASLAIIGVILILFGVDRKLTYKLKLTEKKINKAIALQNKVKIKYINSKTLLDYQYDKYGVDSAYKLSVLYEKYIENKREKERYLKTTGELNDTMIKMLSFLKRLDLYDSNIWQNEVRALSDPKEMVEVRHRLNTRRQKTREQIEANDRRIDELEFSLKLYDVSKD